MRNVPILFLLLAGCGSAPERAPRPASPPSAETGEWDASGDASALRNPGEALANFALTLQGTRYRYGGATREGFDCSGLVFYAHRQFGLTVPRTSSEQAEQAETIKPRKLRPGDLVFFKIDSRKVNHVGIYIGKHRFVHAPGPVNRSPSTRSTMSSTPNLFVRGPVLGPPSALTLRRKFRRAVMSYFHR